jgi:hypothetical protein
MRAVTVGFCVFTNLSRRPTSRVICWTREGGGQERTATEWKPATLHPGRESPGVSSGDGPNRGCRLCIGPMRWAKNKSVLQGARGGFRGVEKWPFDKCIVHRLRRPWYCAGTKVSPFMAFSDGRSPRPSRSTSDSAADPGGWAWDGEGR